MLKKTLAAFGLLLLAFVGIAWIVFSRPVASGDQPGPPAIRFEHTAPPGTTIASGGTFSPDGRHLAFLARSTADGRISLAGLPEGSDVD